ncbi:MAG TPA: TlpA disulfide reductase family protein [Anaerolineales bacterium]|nr:TlpA disulfide reductase family protein [Anaerolineales bacterium]
MQRYQRQIAYLIILGLGLVWIFVSADRSGESTAGKITAPQQGFLAPDFELKTPTGETIHLSELRGQAVLVNLWATWCPPCREEMQSIENVYQEYKGKAFTVLAVNMTYQDDPLAIIPFVNEQKLTFPILLDETGEMANVYQLRSLPSSYFIRPDGIINEVVIGGPMSEALLRTRIEDILR